MEDLFFNVEVPTTVISRVIPVTQGCDAKFVVSPIATADNGEKFPSHFQDGDEIFMVVSVKGQTLRVDATTDRKFVIPSSICDQCRTRWSTWRIFLVREGETIPLAVGSFERHDGSS